MTEVGKGTSASFSERKKVTNTQKCTGGGEITKKNIEGVIGSRGAERYDADIKTKDYKGKAP